MKPNKQFRSSKQKVKANNNTQAKKPMAFSLGDPEPVLEQKITDYLGVFLHAEEKYYLPPIEPTMLAKLLHANAYHESALHFKRDMVMKWFISTPVFRAREMRRFVHDRFLFGNSYAQRITNALGKTLRFKHLPAINMRRMKADDQYCQLRPNRDPLVFKKGEVVHLMDYDAVQQIYGIPEYIGGIQAVLLSESATLFRRKYYANGAHMGYVFYVADGDFDEDDETALIEKIKGSKGAGNFQSMFLNVPGGKPDSVKIIPVGDIATKDEYERVKNVSRAEIISIHRIHPALAGVFTEANGGFGDIEKISRVQYENGTLPSIQLFEELNDFLPAGKKIAFRKPEFSE